MPEILLLTEEDVSDLLAIGQAVEAVEEVFRAFAGGRAEMPPKSYLLFPSYEGDLRVMPASHSSEFAGVKIVNSHPRNPGRGLPAVVGTFLLVSQKTGMPIAIIGATYMTAVRTGAASAVATKYMARRNATSAGLVGSGVQARFQLRALRHVRSLGEVLVWAPVADRDRRDRFLEEMSGEMPSLEFRAVEKVEEAAAADIVVTTTPSRSPVIPDHAIGNGTHINAVGADGPGKQELDPATLRRARVVVDEWEQARHGGEINVPLASGELEDKHVTGTLAEVVTGRVAGRTSNDEITIFDSTGLAIEDVAVGSLVYQKALEKGRGQTIEL